MGAKKKKKPAEPIERVAERVANTLRGINMHLAIIHKREPDLREPIWSIYALIEDLETAVTAHLACEKRE